MSEPEVLEHSGVEHSEASEWQATDKVGETHEQIEGQADASNEAVANEAAAAALDQLHAFIPGDGQVEEEVIDEEEYDFAPLPEHAHDDEHDLSDLVEEETRVAGGSEIGDVIREAQIDRQVISSDDDEFDDSDEEEDVEDEEICGRSRYGGGSSCAAAWAKRSPARA